MFEVVRYRERGYLEYFYTVIRIGTEFKSPVEEEPVVLVEQFSRG